MNIQSILLLSLVVIAFAVVGYRYVRRQRRNPGCDSCNCDCDHCHS